jgi:hypothetical protein
MSPDQEMSPEGMLKKKSSYQEMSHPELLKRYVSTSVFYN